MAESADLLLQDLSEDLVAAERAVQKAEQEVIERRRRLVLALTVVFDVPLSELVLSDQRCNMAPFRHVFAEGSNECLACGHEINE